MDLWLQPVLAQVLAYDQARWGSAGLDGRWHAVRLAVHDLGARDVGDLADGPRTLHRGLSVEMLYEALFIDRTTVAIEQHRTEESAMMDSRESSSAQAIDIAFPGCCAGQQLNLRVILDWRGAKPIAGPTRRRGSMPLPIALDADQQRSIRQWQATATRSHAEPVDPAKLDWQPAQRRFGDDAIEAALGHIDLWGSIDASVQWCDFVGVGCLNDRWVTLPLNLVDGAIDGRARTWLTFDSDDAASLAALGIDTATIRHRLAHKSDCLWVMRRAGLGLFLSLAVDLRPARA
jgi:hypothetical protein